MPQTKLARKDQAKDTELVFSDRKMVAFKHKDGSTEQLEGRWCNICL